MERLEQQQSFSEEQEKTLGELLHIVEPLFDSFTDSNDAYETAVRIDDFYGMLKKKDLNPKDYYLWSLLAPDGSAAVSSDFDTPNGEIEAFIRGLQNNQEEKLAA